MKNPCALKGFAMSDWEKEWERFYEEHKKKWLRIAHKKTNNWHDAEDAVANALGDILKKRASDFCSEDHFKNYIKKAARNKGIDIYHKKQKLLDGGDLQEEPGYINGDLEERFEKEILSMVEQKVKQSKTFAEIKKTEKVKEILRLRNQANTFEEIAENLGIDSSDARVTAHRINKELKAELTLRAKEDWSLQDLVDRFDALWKRAF